MNSTHIPVARSTTREGNSPLSKPLIGCAPIKMYSIMINKICLENGFAHEETPNSLQDLLQKAGEHSKNRVLKTRRKTTYF